MRKPRRATPQEYEAAEVIDRNPFARASMLRAPASHDADREGCDWCGHQPAKGEQPLSWYMHDDDQRPGAVVFALACCAGCAFLAHDVDPDEWPDALGEDCAIMQAAS